MMTHKWTIMIYMAGDNGRIFDDDKRLMPPLQLQGWQDLAEMAGVKTSPAVATVVQFDSLRRARQYTARYYIDQSSPTGRLVEKIDPVNTGDPRNLTDFIVWGMQNYPAEKYALIDTPEMPARELSSLIVHEYEKRYTGWTRGGDQIVTHAALDLPLIVQTFNKIKKFSELVAEIYPEDFYTKRAFERARKEVQRFGKTKGCRQYPRDIGTDYCDLWHLILITNTIIIAVEGGPDLVFGGELKTESIVSAWDGTGLIADRLLVIDVHLVATGEKSKLLPRYVVVLAVPPHLRNMVTTAANKGTLSFSLRP